MGETKPWYASQAIWGAMIALASGGLRIWGYNITPELETQAAQTVMNFMTMVGGATALIGRIRATKGLTLK